MSPKGEKEWSKRGIGTGRCPTPWVAQSSPLNWESRKSGFRGRGVRESSRGQGAWGFPLGAPGSQERGVGRGPACSGGRLRAASLAGKPPGDRKREELFPWSPPLFPLHPSWGVQDFPGAAGRFWCLHLCGCKPSRRDQQELHLAGAWYGPGAHCGGWVLENNSILWPLRARTQRLGL